ncbi:MAG: hemolysin expression modulating protein [Nitrosomonadaceae bacterium]|nr:hemolysin expression modulating protein [Nitrosomonadaceae bacterium]
MAVTTRPRPNLGSGSVKFIDGFPFEGIGSAGFTDNDLLYIGDDLDNVITGGTGHDEFEGRIGNDTLKGGDGNDDIDGQEGTDKLFGGAGDDILRAGGSKPVIITVEGGKKTLVQGDFDRLTGEGGNDTFGFYGYGSFQVTDFTIGEDRLFFDSQALGIDSVPQLLSFITKITDNGDAGFTAEFLNGAASIELVGVNVNAITADMIVFNL